MQTECSKGKGKQTIFAKQGKGKSTITNMLSLPLPCLEAPSETGLDARQGQAKHVRDGTNMEPPSVTDVTGLDARAAAAAPSHAEPEESLVGGEPPSTAGGRSDDVGHGRIPENIPLPQSRYVSVSSADAGADADAAKTMSPAPTGDSDLSYHTALQKKQVGTHLHSCLLVSLSELLLRTFVGGNGKRHSYIFRYQCI